jgi:hypothetical protein
MHARTLKKLEHQNCYFCYTTTMHANLRTSDDKHGFISSDAHVIFNSSKSFSGLCNSSEGMLQKREDEGGSALEDTSMKRMQGEREKRETGKVTQMQSIAKRQW